MYLIIFENHLKRVWKQFGNYHRRFYWKPGQYQYCQQGKRILCRKEVQEDRTLFFNAITGEEVILTKEATVEAI
jgi:hypothetical protein